MQQCPLRSLLDKGEHPDNKPAYGYTHLHAAVRGGHEAAVQLLLMAGANPETLFNPNRQYHPSVETFFLRGHGRIAPVNLAVAVQNPALVDLLLAEGADPVRAYALHQAAALGDPAVLRLLLAHPKVDVNQKNERGSSPLLAAVTESPEDFCWDVVEVLLESGASVQRDVSTWNWPLYRAVRQEKRAVVDLLTAHGAKLSELRNTDLVHGAATSGTVRTLVYLILQL